MWRWTSGETRANVLRETVSPRTLSPLIRTPIWTVFHARAAFQELSQLPQLHPDRVLMRRRDAGVEADAREWADMAAAYRWSADITDDDALRELLKLNRGDECSLVRPPAANGESLTFSGYCRHRGTAYARPPSAKADAGCVFRLRHGPLCQDVTHTLPER